MLNTVGGTVRPRINKGSGQTCCVRIAVQDSSAAEMLQGCPVVTANGDLIGHVEYLMIDVHTEQLRYVIAMGRGYSRHRSAEVVIPWRMLYFDSAMARLVFYTWSEL